MAQLLQHPRSVKTFANQRLKTQAPFSLYNPVNTVSMDIGFVLIVLSLCGVFMPNFLGLNLSKMHCLVLAVCGLIGVRSGLSSSGRTSMVLTFGLGVFFILNAVIGFLIGEPGVDRGVINVPDELVVRIAPGFLELSTMDHILHAVVGIFFLIEAFAWMRSRSFRTQQ